MASPVAARTYDLTGAKAFSNLCIDPADDDTSGLRVYVRRPGQTPRVVAQYAEGGLDAPIEAPSRIIDGRLSSSSPVTFRRLLLPAWCLIPISRSVEHGAVPNRFGWTGRTGGACRAAAEPLVLRQDHVIDVVRLAAEQRRGRQKQTDADRDDRAQGPDRFDDHFVFEPGGSAPGDSLCGQYTPGRARRMIQLGRILGR